MTEVEYYSGLTLTLSHMQRIECQTNESIFFSGSLARDSVGQLYGFNHFFEHSGKYKQRLNSV